MKTSKFFLSTFIAAAAMTSTAYADLYVSSDYNSSTSEYGTTRFSDYGSALSYYIATYYNNGNEPAMNMVVEKGTANLGNYHGGGSNGLKGDKNDDGLNNLSLIVRNGAEAKRGLNAKWDMSYAVTIEAGSSLIGYGGNSDSHVKNALTLQGKEKDRVTLDFSQGGMFDVRDKGSLTASYADITVSSFTARDTVNVTNNSTLTTAGSFVVAAEKYFLPNTVTVDNSTLIVGNLTINKGGVLKGDGVLNITDSTLSARTITNNGTITFSGDCTLESGVLNGKVTISKGAVLTVASNSLLEGTGLKLTNNGAILYKSIDAAVTGKSVTVGSKDNQVVLSSNARITVKKAEEIDISAEGVDVPEGALAAWSFDIENNDEAVTVTMNVGTGLSLDTIRIMHKGDDDTAWKDFTDTVTNKSYDGVAGTLTFTTTSFSDYSAVKASSVPEPSAFGFLAGLGALALVAARRRRK